jgi:hypothetical protein
MCGSNVVLIAISDAFQMYDNVYFEFEGQIT